MQLGFVSRTWETRSYEDCTNFLDLRHKGQISPCQFGIDTINFMIQTHAHCTTYGATAAGSLARFQQVQHHEHSHCNAYTRSRNDNEHDLIAPAAVVSGGNVARAEGTAASERVEREYADGHRGGVQG